MQTLSDAPKPESLSEEIYRVEQKLRATSEKIEGSRNSLGYLQKAVASLVEMNDTHKEAYHAFEKAYIEECEKPCGGCAIYRYAYENERQAAQEQREGFNILQRDYANVNSHLKLASERSQSLHKELEEAKDKIKTHHLYECESGLEDRSKSADFIELESDTLQEKVEQLEARIEELESERLELEREHYYALRIAADRFTAFESLSLTYKSESTGSSGIGKRHRDNDPEFDLKTERDSKRRRKAKSKV
jgi:chromosome segregation ATPase